MVKQDDWAISANKEDGLISCLCVGAKLPAKNKQNIYLIVVAKIIPITFREGNGLDK